MNPELINHLMIWPIGLSAIAAVLAGKLVTWWYKKNGWLDDPKVKKHPKVVHTYPVPRGGGLVVLGAVLLGMLVFIEMDKHAWGIIGGMMILGVLGVWDDVKDISPYWRLGGGLVAGLCVVASGIGLAFVTNPINGGIIHLNEPQIPIFFAGAWHTIWLWSDVLALIWLVWCMNMLNWSKGVDGQLPGIVVIAAIVIGVLSLKFTEDVTQWNVVTLSGIVAGAYLGLLFWNVYPQRMMPGYGGGSIAGYLLAVLSILSGAKLATLILVLGIPMIDAGYVIVRRLGKGKSPIWGDKSHFHHKLLEMGWSKRKIASFYWLITALLGLMALQLNARQKAFTIVLLTLSFGGLLLWINWLITSSKRSDRDSG